MRTCILAGYLCVFLTYAYLFPRFCNATPSILYHQLYDSEDSLPTSKKNDADKKLVLNTLVFKNAGNGLGAEQFIFAQQLMEIHENLGESDSAILVWKFIDRNFPEMISDKLEWKLRYVRMLNSTRLSDDADITFLEDMKKKPLAPLPDNDKFQIYSLLGKFHQQKGNDHYAIQNFKLAKNVINATDNISFQQTAEVYGMLVRYYSSRGALRKGHRLCDEFLTQRDKGQINSSVEALHIRNEKARIYFREGRTKKAIDGFEDLIYIYPKYVQETDPLFIGLLNDLAVAYKKQNKPHQAYVYLRWAYEMIYAKEMIDPALAVKVIKNLAEVYSNKGDQVSAQLHYNEARLLGKQFY